MSALSASALSASAINALVDLVLPSLCVGCGDHGRALCATCIQSLTVSAAGSSIWAAGAYDGALRAALIAYKERGRRDLAHPLARLLGGSVDATLLASRSPPARVALVCVPSARSVAAARGGDHVLRLARKVAWRSGLRVAPALSFTRGVRDSAGLGSADRARNMTGAMTAAPPFTGWQALLVDDIVTTGATLREGRRALEEAGWGVAGAAVVAATARRNASHRHPTSSAQELGLA